MPGASPRHRSRGRGAPGARLDAFARRSNTARCVLLGEGPSDAPLFFEIGLMMQAARAWEWLRMEHTPRIGGGDTTAGAFVTLADEGHIMLAVGDTDRRHPHSDVGGTYRKLHNAAQGRPAYQRAEKIHVRTAEALIPLAVYREVLTSPERRANLDKIEQLIAADPDVLACAHLKDGIKWFQVKRPKSEPEGAYWRRIAGATGREGCREPESPECERREDCRCYVVDPLGGAAVSTVVTWLQGQREKRPLAERFRVSSEDGPSRDRELSALADEILSFGIALPPLT